MFPADSAVLIIAALLVCSIGFYRFIWFMSVGYGLAIAAIGAVILVLGSGLKMQAVTAVLCILLVVYGFRLGGFLLIREVKNAAYKKMLDSQMEKPVPLLIKVIMWLFMGLLYFCQTSPVWYRVNNTGAMDAIGWLGALVALAGILMEAEADREKSDQKKKRPGKPAMEGLYRFCRCPNYFGELVFWTGIFISGLSVMKGSQWAIALIGYVSIAGIMISGARRLEKRQNHHYGSDPAYQQYAASTPLLVPFLPVRKQR